MYTPPKFNSSPLKSYRAPIGKDRLPTNIFQGYVKLRGGSIYIYIIYHTPRILVSNFGIHHIWMREVPAWTYLPSLCIHHSKQLDQLLQTKQAKEIRIYLHLVIFSMVKAEKRVSIHHTLECFGWKNFKTDEFLKKVCLPKMRLDCFFFARATAWRPFLSRRAFHDHQVEGCGFVGLTFPGLKVSYIHEINTFTWRCLQVFSLVGNTEISVYIDIYIIALFLLHMYHVLNE